MHTPIHKLIFTIHMDLEFGYTMMEFHCTCYDTIIQTDNYWGVWWWKGGEGGCSSMSHGLYEDGREGGRECERSDA